MWGCVCVLCVLGWEADLTPVVVVAYCKQRINQRLYPEHSDEAHCHNKIESFCVLLAYMYYNLSLGSSCSQPLECLRYIIKLEGLVDYRLHFSLGHPCSHLA